MRTSKRQVIYTTEPEITEQNIIKVLQKAKGVHALNAANIQSLFEFEDGEQPLTRVKKYRPEIDVECIDNVAHEVTVFHQGYEWGNPITLIQRGQKDSGTSNEGLAISLLNEQYEAAGIKTKTQKLGKDVIVCGLGYTHIEINDDWEVGDSYFNLNVLDPLTTFIVRSSYYLDKRPIMGVTFNKDENNVRHYTCFTRDTRYDICEEKIVAKYENQLKRIPIVEWIGNYDGRGLWELQVSDMENLNLLISDFSNDVDQNTQAIWHSNDIEFPTEEITLEDGTKKEITRKPKQGEIVQSFTTKDGKTPFMEGLTLNYDYANMLANILARRALILQKCFVPNRNDDSGGSTGSAMNSATGWSSLDVMAESIEAIQESCKMEEVRLVLKAIELSTFVPEDSPMKQIKAKDIVPNIKRQKLSEMNVKVNSIATQLAHGIYGKHAIESANFYPDPQQVWEDSRPLIEAYQMSLFQKATTADTEKAPNTDRIMQDESDQIGNTPLIDGMAN